MLNSRNFAKPAFLRSCRQALAALLFFSMPAMAAEDGHAQDIVKFIVENHGKSDHDVLATFGSVFAPGDVPRGSSLDAISGDGAPVRVQIDAKASHGDGSLRHGVVTVLIPKLGHSESTSITLRRKNGAPELAPAVALSTLPADFDTTVTLKTKSGVLTASAKALLAAGHADTWLSGPLASEWWVSGPLRDARGVADPHLYVEFGIRSYGKDRPLRVEADVENDWSYVPGPKTEFYDAEIKANGRSVLSKPGLVQPSHTRWRCGFWWNEPVATYVTQNLAYLEKTRAIPNYDPTVSVSYNSLAKFLEQFESVPHGPMSSGIIEKYMPTTGGRPDIAPLPQWQAFYLLTMDPRAYAATLETADDGASFSSHYRNEKTLRPITLEDYPKFSTHSNMVGHGPGQLQSPDTSGYADPLVPDASHEPSLDFLPYLITGDRFYLEELEFWTEWNLSGTGPEYRDFAKGLVKWDQVRAQAWSLRTLAQAEYITPNNDPLKAVFRRQLKANIDWYETAYVKNPTASPLNFIPYAGRPYDDGRAMAPWQDDFFTWSVGYVQSLGDVDALSLLRWKGVFPVQRMIAPGFCWILASSYTLRVKDSAEGPFYTNFAKVYEQTLPGKIKDHAAASGPLKCASPEMAEALGHHDPEEMGDEAVPPDGYAAIMQTALAAAVDGDVTGADQAWRKLQSRSLKPDFSTSPEWDIVPRR